MGKSSDLSPRKRALIRCLLDEKIYSQRQIATKLGVSQKSVSRIKILAKTGSSLSPKRKRKCGRKPKISPRLERKLLQMAKKNRRATSKVLSNNLQQYGVEVTASTIRRRLCASGLPARRPRKKAKITPAMAIKRLLWAKQVQERFRDNWNEVVFSDESIFAIGEESSQYVRRSGNEEFHQQCVVQTVKHPTSVMVWSCMSIKGTGKLYIVEGTMKQDQYKKVLETRLIPQVNEWFPDGKFIFMQDGAPCHKARSVMNYLADSGIEVLPWPGNSPDANPIENLWAIVKRKLKQKTITTRVELIEELLQIWHRDEEIANACTSLMESMPERVQSIISSKGYHTKY